MASIRVPPHFRFRLAGLDRMSLEPLARVLDVGGDARALVRVARVGKVLYLIHGAQWLAACRLGGRNTISAHVAKMTMAEATAAARSFGAMHSEPLSRADKEAAWNMA